MAAITFETEPLHDLHLTQRGRMVALVAFVTVLFALLSLWSAGSVAVPAGTRVEPTRTVVVSPGQTLWDIAAEVQPGADPRPTIERILDLNGLRGGVELQAGQRVAVPAG